MHCKSKSHVLNQCTRLIKDVIYMYNIGYQVTVHQEKSVMYMVVKRIHRTHCLINKFHTVKNK